MKNIIGRIDSIHRSEEDDFYKEENYEYLHANNDYVEARLGLKTSYCTLCVLCIVVKSLKKLFTLLLKYV